jgi:hypothetical protein
MAALKEAAMPRQWFEEFTIAVADSSRLMGMFMTECGKHYFNATMYDRSDQFARFVKQEIALGKSMLATPDCRRMALTAERNQAHPAKADVTVTFRSSGDLEMATVAGPVYKRVLTFRFTDSASGESVEQFVKQVIQAVGTAA